MMYNQKLLNP